MRTLVYLALFVLATSLVCPNDKYYVSVLKKSGSGGALETYVISGIFSEQSTVLATGNAVPAGQNATQEFCLDMTSDGVYTIELKHSTNGMWSAGSMVTVKNDVGISVYSGSMTASSKSFQFTLNYLVNAGGPIYVFQSFDNREWWQREYVMDSNWVLASSTTTARTVEGNNLNRQSFNIPNLEKYSHIVIRLYYQHGLILFVNGIRYYVDNVSLMFSEENYSMTQMEVSSSSHSQYVWKDIIIPASLLYSTNNVIIISLHYEEYEERQESMTFAVMGVYASLPEEQCSPLPIEVTLSNGLKEESNADYLIDGDMTTQAVFKAATMHVTVETPIPAIVSEYTLYRTGEDTVESWKLMNCGAYSNGQCSQWRASSIRQESIKKTGSYAYPCNENTNLLSSSHRLQFFTLDGSIKDTSLNELTLYTCGMTVDLTMYNQQIIEYTSDEAISLTPEYPIEGATYSIYPTLPYSAQFNTTTGAITGTANAFGSYSLFTIVRNNNGFRTKFFLVIITSNPDPTEAPTEVPTEAPTAAPTVAPTVTPTEAPKSNTGMIITIVVIVVIIIVVIVVIALVSKNKKSTTLPTKALPVV